MRRFVSRGVKAEPMAIAGTGVLPVQIATSPRDDVATTRVASLDSLRGLAALSVVTCHYFILLANTPFGQYVSPWFLFPPLSLFKTAYGAVILFFVLSGYVLALSLRDEAGGLSWGGFAVRRFCRIWPPYAATILISFLIGYVALASETSLPSVWQVNTWHRDDITLGNLIDQIGMATSRISLDVPGWSLVHELRITLAFPLMLFCLRRAPATTIGASFFLQIADQCGPPWLAGLIPGTAIYIVYFAAGAWLALNNARIPLLKQTTPPTKALLAATAVLFLATPGNQPWDGVIAGLGAILIIAIVITSPKIGRLLSAPWCAALGRVSYSLYLTHVVVLMALGRGLGGWLPVWLILIIAAPVIGIVAWIGYRWVEQPSIRIGRLITARLGAARRSEALLDAGA